MAEPATSQAYPNPREGAAAEKIATEARPPLGMHDLPLRQYMDSYVVPTLLQGLNTVAEERPDNPVEFLAYYLLKNNPMGSAIPPRKDGEAGARSAEAS
mmetsp:Transcript_6395/g.13986  ORF Transcript_6395/g.13986 Transcript_6395/m.13986 type:complete len:99 (+) Transcript_6395:98-394(+)|eukprot:CAMPEP_0178405222 /NCGR_PEP_ID=MMETSP0689_2-20121128/18288_1 /TAXON_ID=160604 /ORGANISM="Amphidinium massartii, Strain CS-259" /LENGTH=98 /DNA_ID=CAMNT_0020026231 /DNA_START=162 /DNA_END=458 /DNA_ORIENTATION=+